MGLDPSHIDVHLLAKHSTVHDSAEQQAMSAKEPSFVIVVDQGSRKAPPVVTTPGCSTLILDHHLSDEFPEDAEVSSTSEALIFANILRLSLPATIHRLPLHRYSHLRFARRCTRAYRQIAASSAQWVRTVILVIRLNGNLHFLI